MENNQAEQGGKKIGELNTTKCNNIHILWIPEEERKEYKSLAALPEWLHPSHPKNICWGK